MQCESCKETIRSFVRQGPSGLARLKELLPVLFDSHRIFTVERQSQVLTDCLLMPVFQTRPFHHVTFVMPGD